MVFLQEEAIRQSFEDVQRRKQVQQQHHPGQIQHPQASVQQPGPTTATYPQQQHQQPGALATASQPPAVGATEAPPAAIRSSFNVGVLILYCGILFISNIYFRTYIQKL